MRRLGRVLPLLWIGLLAGEPAAPQTAPPGSVSPVEELRETDPLFFEDIVEFRQNMKSTSPEARREAVYRLVSSCDCTFREHTSRVPALVDLLTDALRDKDARVRQEVIRSVILLKDSRIAPLLAVALHDKDKDVRSTAAYELAGLAESGIKEPEVMELLIGALANKAADVRAGAAKGLGSMGDLRAVEPLIAALRDRKVCEEAAEALGKLGDERAVEPLIASLKDNDCAWTASEALGKLGDERATLPLITALQKSRNPYLKARIATALGSVGDPRAIEVLTAAGADPNLELREAAGRALSRLGAPAGNTVLTEVGETKRRLAENESTVTRLIELVDRASGLQAMLREYSVYRVQGGGCSITYTERVTEGVVSELRWGQVSLDMARMDASSVEVVEKGGGFFVVSSGRGVAFEGTKTSTGGRLGEEESAGVDLPFRDRSTAETVAADLRRAIEVCSASR